MSLTIYDVFGNVVSAILILMIPATSRLFNQILEAKGGFPSGDEAKNTIKLYMSYSRLFSMIFASLFFSLCNSFYLMYKDGLKWSYVIYGFCTVILLFSLIYVFFRLNQFKIDEPLTQSIYNKFECDFDIEDYKSYPIWAKILWYTNPARILMFVCLLSYIVPSIIVLRQVV